MTAWEKIRRAGSVLMILSMGVLLQDPIRMNWTEQPAFFLAWLPLAGFPAFAGFLEWAHGFSPVSPKILSGLLARMLVLAANLWLFIWCLLWLILVSPHGETGPEIVKRLGAFHLFGVGIALLGTLRGYFAQGPLRDQRFLAVVGWACAYVFFIQWAFVGPRLILQGAGILGGLLWMVSSLRLQNTGGQ
jgi:hypothetical protein